MKLIHTDNYGGDYPDERFVTELPALSQKGMQEVADAINGNLGTLAPRYYVVVPDDYVLRPGFEP